MLACASTLHYVVRMSDTSLSAIINIVRAASLLEQRLTGILGSIHGLSLTEAMLLMHLERAPMARLTRTDLARRLNVNPSTVTRMSLPLEKTGLTGRQSDERDARLAYVTLTEAGLSAAAGVRETLRMHAPDFFRDRWSNPDIAQLSDLLGRLVAGEPGDIA